MKYSFDIQQKDDGCLITIRLESDNKYNTRLTQIPAITVNAKFNDYKFNIDVGLIEALHTLLDNTPLTVKERNEAMYELKTLLYFFELSLTPNEPAKGTADEPIVESIEKDNDDNVVNPDMVNQDLDNND